MRHVQLRSKRNRIVVAGAFLAICAVGGTAINANASWSVTTKPSAWFICESDCQAGGIGPVGHGTIVGPESPFPDQKIGAWTRTVLIECKETGTVNGAYRVRVQDRNWAGIWSIAKPNLAQEFDDSSFPVC
jgi:hypothetical protein